MSSTGQWEALFGDGQKWRVCEEVTGVIEQDGCRVTFERGQFEITPLTDRGGAYRSPLSTNLGRRGVLCVRTDDRGVTDLPGSRQAFGAAAVERARAEYGAVW